jgi:hypothetical protein
VAGGALVVGPPALHQRDGARDHGALAGADAAREPRKVGACGFDSGHGARAFNA